jgi:hypothetical protein
VSTTNQGIDAIVRRSSAVEGEFGESRERIDASALDTVRATSGVAAAEGSIQGFAQLVRADGTTKPANGLGMTIGSSWIADERLNPFSLAQGRAPEPGEMILDKATAEREGWTLGDTITVLAKDGPETFTLSGIATFGEVDGIPGSSLVATEAETAQRLFAEPGRFDAIVVAAEAGTTPDQLAVQLQASVGDAGIEVTTGAADTADQQAQLRDDLSFFNTFLMAFAYVSLFVGTFIIYNTFSIIIAQRMREMAMLRAVGASRRQVLREKTKLDEWTDIRRQERIKQLVDILEIKDQAAMAVPPAGKHVIVEKPVKTQPARPTMLHRHLQMLAPPRAQPLVRPPRRRTKTPVMLQRNRLPPRGKLDRLERGRRRDRPPRGARRGRGDKTFRDVQDRGS